MGGFSQVAVVKVGVVPSWRLMELEVNTATSSCCWNSMRELGWAAAAAKPAARTARERIVLGVKEDPGEVVCV
jgi:hypothetical protein